MIERLRQAMQNGNYIDIFYKINNQYTRVYRRFLITNINEKEETYCGFTNEMRMRTESERVLTSDSIGFICDIINPYINIFNVIS